MFLGYRECPHCKMQLDADTAIFVCDDDEVIGCEYCIRQTYADFEDDYEDELEAEAADFAYHSGKEEAYCNSQEALLRGCD